LERPFITSASPESAEAHHALSQDGGGRAGPGYRRQRLVPLLLLGIEVAADAPTQPRSNDAVQLLAKRLKVAQLVVVGGLLMER
jgi:hypothetical protein